MKDKYLGIDIGGTQIKLGLVSGEGEILSRCKVNVDRSGEEAVMDTVKRAVREFCGSESVDIKSLGGIGISAPGSIDKAGGRVAVNGGNVPGWSGTEVCGPLEAEFGIPVTMANDANCAVLGEAWTGAARGCTDVVCVTIGTGVGGGIISGGKLVEGIRGFGGEIGHFPTHAGGKKCLCGIRGCYERYASTSSLIRKAVTEDPELKSGRILFSAAEAGDRHALALLDEWTDEIAYGIAGFVHVFDPQLVLIGGGVSAQEKLLIEPLRRKVLGMIMPDFADELEFRRAQLGNDAGMIGAVYYLLSRENISRRM
jgi:glucokinase